MQPWQFELLEKILVAPNPIFVSPPPQHPQFRLPEFQLPRSDGRLDPQQVIVGQLFAQWLEAHPQPDIALPARARTTEQWIGWLRAEGFIDEAENPYGYFTEF